MPKQDFYEIVLIGTSPIAIIEAYFYHMEGKSVLMIDDQDAIGGAWKSLKNPYFEDVENAIHYFLPDIQGRNFLSACLGVNIIEVQNKYRVFKFPLFGYVKLKYHSHFSRFVSEFATACTTRAAIKYFLKSILRSFDRIKIESFFIAGGSPELIERVTQLKKSAGFEALLNARISEIKINSGGLSQLFYEFDGRRCELNFDFLVVSHGSKIANVRVDDRHISLVQKMHPRPAMHIFFEDERDEIKGEWIFYNHKLFKYVHNVTKYAKPKSSKYNNLKVFVFALKHDVTYYEGIEVDIFKELVEAKILTKQSKLIHYIWSDIFLPALDDNDLELLSCESDGRIRFLKTEDFVRGIGLRHKDWERYFN